MVQWRRRKKIVRKEAVEDSAKKIAVQWRRKEEIIGKEVVDGDAKRIGMTRDIVWSEDGKLALVIESGDNEFILPFPGIEKVGDVIFAKPNDSLEKISTIICPHCKTKNLQEAKFCSKCGHKLEAESHTTGDEEDPVSSLSTNNARNS